MILDHVLGYFTSHQEICGDRCINNLLPLIKRKVNCRANLDISCNVYQNVNLAEMIDCLLYPINDLLLKGADVISLDVHVSGHACQEDIKLIYTLVQPQYAIPVHGEYKHLIAQGKIARDLGIPKKNVFILRSCDVLELNARGAAVNGKVPVGAILVDGKGVGDVGNAVLRDRQHLSEDGIVIVAAMVEKETGELIGAPSIQSRGFVYMREADELIEDCMDLVVEELSHAREKGTRDNNKLKGMLRDELGNFLWRRTERRPIIIPIIMDVRA